MSVHNPEDLRRIYARRFQGDLDYRRSVWRVLIDDYFQKFVRPSDTLLDLGCGYGEFINQVRCERKLAMDLNPEAPTLLAPDVRCVLQDCSAPWDLPTGTLDVVFTSNFFEHLPDKSALGRTMDEIWRCLKAGGQLIAMGPNIKFVGGAYWDFWDHYLPLTDVALCEALTHRAFVIVRCFPRFLPYRMAGGPKYPLTCLKLYLRCPLAWRLFGKQFLVIARKSVE